MLSNDSESVSYSFFSLFLAMYLATDSLLQSIEHLQLYLYSMKMLRVLFNAFDIKGAVQL